MRWKQTAAPIDRKRGIPLSFAPAVVLYFGLCLSNGPASAEAPPSRQEPAIPLAIRQPAAWRYTTARPVESWSRPVFDDAAWTEAENAFGSGKAPAGAAKVRTRWDSPDIWMRRPLILP